MYTFITAAVTAHAQTKSRPATKTSTTPTNWGIGLRLGDPTGLTAKKYLGGGKALEFNLGRSTYWGYDYSDQFYKNNKYKNYYYIGYRGKSAISFQAHYLFQNEIPNADGLQWYWGIGPQLRTKKICVYLQGCGSGPYINGNETNIDFGVDGILGLSITSKMFRFLFLLMLTFCWNFLITHFLFLFRVELAFDTIFIEKEQLPLMLRATTKTFGCILSRM